MSDFGAPKLPERNPVTYQNHRKEVLWQITIPAIVGILVIVGLLVLVLLVPGGAEGHSRWADISLIWLILPILVLALVLLLIFGGLAYAIVKLIGIIPPYTRKAQDAVDRAGAAVRRASDAAVEPVLRAKSFSASVRALRRR
jgi:uncharacterized membrane protein YedE/YeeE